MALALANYTLTYSEMVKGWPSFYSYEPEFIIGMNQYLYTFNQGNLYRHNVNTTRNQFYGAAAADTTITTVFNQDSLTTKIFKTISLESTDAWEAIASSDIQADRTMDASWFEEKEGDWFSFIRGLTDGTENLNLRSANGLGTVTTVDDTILAATTLTFPAGFKIGSIISIGDTVYATTATVQAGEVVAPLDPTSNVLTIDTTVAGSTVPSNGEFILYVKNQIAESHGLLGHYAVVKFTNSSEDPTEMIAVKTDIMKSYP